MLLLRCVFVGIVRLAELTERRLLISKSDIIRLHMDRHLVHKGASQMQVMSSQVPQTNLFSPKVSCGT